MKEKSGKAESLNAAVKGHTELVLFSLEADGGRTGYDLTLGLAKPTGQQVTLRCSDVQNLELNPNGEQFRQLRGLHVEDLREDGLDRIQFSVEDVEGEALFLHCANIQVETS